MLRWYRKSTFISRAALRQRGAAVKNTMVRQRLLCRISRPTNITQFEFEDFGHEADHLRRYKEQQKRHTEEKIMRLHRKVLSFLDIAERTGLSKTAVVRLVKKG